MRSNVAIMIAIVLSTTSGQLVPPPPPGFSSTGFNDITYVNNIDPSLRPHKDVVFNSMLENDLPQDMLKSNKFYSNPAIAEGLARESLIQNKEFPLRDRAADHIPRAAILKIVKNAGFVNRRK